MNQFMDEKVKEMIGFNYLIKQLTINSPYGISYLRHLEPFTNPEQLMKEYQLIAIFIQHLNKNELEKVEFTLHKLKDICSTIKNCREGEVLDLVDLYEIKMQAITMNELADCSNVLNIEEFFIEDCLEIIQLLSPNETQITADFYIYNSYSEHLTQIREEKRKIEYHFFELNDKEREKLQTLRSKYVILEREEELQVRKKLSKKLTILIECMERNIEKIAHVDFLIAKAKLAILYHGVEPIISANQLYFQQMSNPMIKYQVEHLGNGYTENSLDMHQGTTVLTGANMSGKSSVIKTVALNVFLAHLGFYVFCSNAKIPLVSGIEYIGGETENFIHGLSSFGLEISSINETIHRMKKATYLVCIDEFARSTNPSEGQKFVSAFAQFSNFYPSYTILATHYDGVVTKEMNHYQIVGLKEEEINASAIHSIRDIHRYMDYSLKKVTQNHLVPKEAYKVSVLLDIDQDFKVFLDKCYEE